MSSPEERLQAALDQITAAGDDAAEALEELEDVQAAFTWATRLRERAEQVVKLMIAARDRMAARVYGAERLALSKLGQRWGVSKARAWQYIIAGRKAEEDEEDER